MRDIDRIIAVVVVVVGGVITKSESMNMRSVGR